MTRNIRRLLAAAAILYILFALPATPWAFDLFGLAHLPWEPLLLILLARFLPARVWTWVRPLIVAVTALVMTAKVANLVTMQAFDRPFALATDLPMIPVLLGTLAMNNVLIGVAAAAGAALFVIMVSAAVWWSLTTLRAVAPAPLGIGGLVAATVLLSFVTVGDPPVPVTNAGTTAFVRDQAKTFAHDLADLKQFKEVLARPEPPPQPRALAGLRGVDVLIIFIESYGRSALERVPYQEIVRPALKDSGRALADAGFHASSAWLTSPTFGGQSWLAHSTVLSGLPVTADVRYRALVKSQRSTLVADFKRAGWRTAAVMAEITGLWPEARYFGFDAAYTASELGYGGPSFGYVTMPDQFVLQSFSQKEFAKPDRPPLMAEIALISSHIPWAPLPKLVPWDEVKDGAIFATARTPETAGEVWSKAGGVEVFYARSVDYVLRTVTSFITTYGRDNTLVILMGDHQPIGLIAGEDASHQVPVHLIARNETLLRALDGGAWATGMTPAADGPVTPMTALRSRILSAFTPHE